MKKLLLACLLVLPLFSAQLHFKEGFVAAHTEMALDSTIDPMATQMQTAVAMEDGVTTLKGEVRVAMIDFISDNKKRDEHMYETVESSKFSDAVYDIESVKKETDGSYTIDGKMKLHGVERPLSFKGEIVDDGSTVSISLKSAFNMTDFNIEAPCLMFMCVREDVDLFVKTVFTR